MLMKDEVILVDPYDNAIGVVDKQVAHQKGLRHRAFSIFVFDQPKKPMRLLLQKRCRHKYHSGQLWSNTCCSHPKPNETILSAASRRLEEEMGFKTTIKLHIQGIFNYKVAFSHGLIENEVDYVLVDYYNNQPVVPNDVEVESVLWIDVDMLRQDAHFYPSKYTAWFVQALAIAMKAS